MNEHVTLVHPDARDPTARAISSGFPADLLRTVAAAGRSGGRERVDPGASAGMVEGPWAQL